MPPTHAVTAARGSLESCSSSIGPHAMKMLSMRFSTPGHDPPPHGHCGWGVHLSSPGAHRGDLNNMGSGSRRVYLVAEKRCFVACVRGMGCRSRRVETVVVLCVISRRRSGPLARAGAVRRASLCHTRCECPTGDFRSAVVVAERALVSDAHAPPAGRPVPGGPVEQCQMTRRSMRNEHPYSYTGAHPSTGIRPTRRVSDLRRRAARQPPAGRTRRGSAPRPRSAQTTLYGCTPCARGGCRSPSRRSVNANARACA